MIKHVLLTGLLMSAASFDAKAACYNDELGSLPIIGPFLKSSYHTGYEVTDDNSVYYCTIDSSGQIKDSRRVENVNGQKFVKLSAHYGSDTQTIFYKGLPSDRDIATFDAIYDGYGVDKFGVYKNNRLVSRSLNNYFKSAFMQTCVNATAQQREFIALNTKTNGGLLLAQCRVMAHDNLGKAHMGFSAKGVSDISFISALKSGPYLDLNADLVSDFSPLAQLKLQYLTLSSKLKTAPVLPSIASLNSLTITAPNIDVASLHLPPGLKSLRIYSNALANMCEIKKLKGLTRLSIKAESDIGCLSDLSELVTLNISSSAITDLSVVLSFDKLQELSINNTQVSDIAAVSRLTQLSSLSLNNTLVSELPPMDALRALTSINLKNTNIDDISALVMLPKLQYLQVDKEALKWCSPWNIREIRQGQSCANSQGFLTLFWSRYLSFD